MCRWVGSWLEKGREGFLFLLVIVIIIRCLFHSSCLEATGGDGCCRLDILGVAAHGVVSASIGFITNAELKCNHATFENFGQFLQPCQNDIKSLCATMTWAKWMMVMSAGVG